MSNTRADRTNFRTKAQAIAEVVNLRRLLSEAEQETAQVRASSIDLRLLAAMIRDARRVWHGQSDALAALRGLAVEVVQGSFPAHRQDSREKVLEFLDACGVQNRTESEEANA